MARCGYCNGGRVYGEDNISHCQVCRGTGFVEDPPGPPITVNIVGAPSGIDPDRWLREMESTLRRNADPNRRNATPMPWCVMCGRYHVDGDHNGEGLEMDQDKKNAREKAKSKLIHEWDHGPAKSRERYRLVATADHTPGYEDRYHIERLGVDGLGEPRWDGVAEIKNAPTSNDTFQLMLSAIKSLLKDPS